MKPFAGKTFATFTLRFRFQQNHFFSGQSISSRNGTTRRPCPYNNDIGLFTHEIGYSMY
jgi:hypothetical protein